MLDGVGKVWKSMDEEGRSCRLAVMTSFLCICFLPSVLLIFFVSVITAPSCCLNLELRGVRVVECV